MKPGGVYPQMAEASTILPVPPNSPTAYFIEFGVESLMTETTEVEMDVTELTCLMNANRCRETHECGAIGDVVAGT